jgi:hypothetical protein
MLALEHFKALLMKMLVEKDVVYNIKKAQDAGGAGETPRSSRSWTRWCASTPCSQPRTDFATGWASQFLRESRAGRRQGHQAAPVVCHAYKRGLRDGRPDAVHVPLTQAAQASAWTLMLSSRNLLKSGHGKTNGFPSQDWSWNQLPDQGKGEGQGFGPAVFLLQEAVMAWRGQGSGLGGRDQGSRVQGAHPGARSIKEVPASL